MHSYYQRIRARRGAQVAIVATSRKLACLFWCLLTREEDYAYAQPSLTAKKLRRLELAAGAPKGAGGAGIWSTNKAMREAEQALARQAEAAYRAHRRRLAATAATKKGRRRDNGARNLKSPIEGDRQRGGPMPRASLFSSSSPTPEPTLANWR